MSQPFDHITGFHFLCFYILTLSEINLPVILTDSDFIKGFSSIKLIQAIPTLFYYRDLKKFIDEENKTTKINVP